MEGLEEIAVYSRTVFRSYYAKFFLNNEWEHEPTQSELQSAMEKDIYFSTRLPNGKLLRCKLVEEKMSLDDITPPWKVNTF